MKVIRVEICPLAAMLMRGGKTVSVLVISTIIYQRSVSDIMKLLSKILAVIMCMTVLVSAIVPLSAAEGGEKEEIKDLEVVFLFDVSGSMNFSDPQFKTNNERLSTQAAFQFASYNPSESNMYITIVPYHSLVYTGFETVNVATPDGMDVYQRYLEQLRGGTLATYSGMENKANICWQFKTDIGSALDYAAEILLNSDRNSKKAVVLFTDGHVQAEYISDEESTALAKENSDALKAAGIPVFSVGLNCDGTVDKAFLENVSGCDETENTEKITGAEATKVINSAEQIADAFAKIYEHLHGKAKTGSGPKTVPVNSEQTYYIYGQAVKEVVINNSSSVRFFTVEVISPNGVKVADVDILNPENNSVMSDYCIVTCVPTSFTVKLIKPQAGDWTVKVKGEEGTAFVREMFFFELELNDGIDKSEVYVDDVLEYTAFINNPESGVRLTDEHLYLPEDGGSALAETENVNGVKALYNGTLNANSDGYDFSIPFEAPGEYKITTLLSHSQFAVKNEHTVKAVGPVLKMDAEAAADDSHSINVKVNLANPISGSDIISVPAYLVGREAVIICRADDGTVVGDTKVKLSEITSGTYSCEFVPEKIGNYTVDVAISGSDCGVEAVSDSVNLAASTITVASGMPDTITKKGLSAGWTETVDLTGMFTDSDGDALQYSITSPEGSVFTAEVVGSSLNITANDFGDAEITLLVTDGDGAEYRHVIALSAVSTLTMLIILIVAAVIIIVAIIILIAIIKKKSIISMRFKVKLECEIENSYDSKKAVYDIASLSNFKNVKPKMLLSKVLSLRAASLNDGATLDGAELDSFISAHCSDITVSGVPFKKAVKIVYNNKEKGKTATYTLRNTNVVVRVGDGKTVTFGTSRSDL